MLSTGLYYNIAMRMRIIINSRLVRPDGMDGIGWFSYEIVRRWVDRFPEHEFVLLTDRKALRQMISGPNVSYKVLFPPARRIFLINWWHKAARKYVNKFKPDIYVSLDGQYEHPTNVPVLTVIHDLNFYHHPEWMPKHIAEFYNSSMPDCANKATRIATVSEYSRRDISKSYAIAMEKIDVVYNGFNEGLLQLENDPQKDDPYFLFVGIQVPRKNIVGMIRSFTLFKETYGTTHQLKLAGHDYLWNEEMKSVLENSSAKADIQLLGRKTFDDLKVLYSGAEALLYIPHFEGFGIPILEGFAAGVPVICSNSTSLPEVAGDAALQFEPTDYKSISGAMNKIVTDKEFRSNMIENGEKRLQTFNWEKTTTALWNSILKTLTNGA